MELIEIKVKKCDHFDHAFSLPKYESYGASGADIRASFIDPDKTMEIRPGERVLIPTGLCFEIPLGYEMQVRPRSGLSLKTGLLIVNSPGTIDADYRGELKIIMGNLGQKSEFIHHGDRVAQIVIMPVIQGNFVAASELSSTERGQRGFGSTGSR